MKRILAALLTIALTSCASMQPVTFTESEYVVKVFEDVKGTKEQLYLKANDWMIKTFNDATSVIQHSDKEEGVIIGKYLMNGKVHSGAYGTTLDTRVYAIIDIRVKDQKARIEIKPQDKWEYDSSGMTIYDYSKQKAIADMQKLIESFYQALQKKDVEF